MLKRFILVSILCLWVSPAFGQGISVSQSVDRTEVAFEDSVLLEYVVTWSGPQSAYLFERPLNPEVEGLKVGRFSSTISTFGTGDAETTTKRLKFTLIPILSGPATIRPAAIEYLKWPDSLPGLLMTEAMSVTVAAPKPREAVSSDSFLSIPMLIGITVVAIVGIVVTILLLRRNRAPAEIVKSPKEVMLERLSELKISAGSDLKKFQTGLHKYLNEYLAAAYHVDVANIAIDEVASHLERTDMPAESRVKIMAWLERAEREKFSPVAAAPGETVRLESEVRAFFEKI
jgi:hypothetical protein